MLTDPENKEVTEHNLKQYKIGSCVHIASALEHSIVISRGGRYCGRCGPDGNLHIQSVRSKIEADKGQKYTY